MRPAKLLVLFVSGLFVHGLYPQSALEFEEFNAAYLQYGNSIESNPLVARAAAQRALNLGRTLFGEDNERTAMLAINYANLLEDEAALVYLDEAMVIYQRIFGVRSEAMIDPLMRLGRMLLDSGKFSLAQDYYQRALSLAEQHVGEDSAISGIIQLEIGAVAFSSNREADALGHLVAAEQILQGVDGIAARDNFVRVNLLLGRIYLQQEQYEAALEKLLVSFEVLAAYPNSPSRIRNRMYLIEVYEKMGLREQATVHCLAIGAIRRQPPGQFLTPLYSVIPGTTEVENGAAGIRVSFTVDTKGFVQDPVLQLEQANNSLSSLLLNAISQFRFAPRFEGGEPIESPEQEYVFRF